MTEAGKALRLFIGARVSLATVRALDDAVRAMRRAESALELKWVAPATYHVTLKFLGWSRPEVVEALRDGVGAALVGSRAVEIECRGLGAFPSAEKARVVWAGIDPAGAARLAEMVDKIERATGALGFQREKRAWHAHVTLARVRAPGDVRGLLAAAPEQTYRHTWVDSLVLFESQMKKDGSEYTEIASWPLESDSRTARRHTAAVEHAEQGAQETTTDGDKYDDEGPG
jgi:RNA 2',3'-cyclic 3'-phosphodiesterase